MSHDERNIPIEYEPASKDWLEVAWLGIKRLLAERNRRELPVARAKEKQNEPRDAVAELVDAAKAALVHVSCVGYPTNAEGGYDKNGAEWNFSDACPNPEDANELKRARMVLAAALAKFGGAP